MTASVTDIDAARAAHPSNGGRGLRVVGSETARSVPLTSRDAVVLPMCGRGSERPTAPLSDGAA